jgi:hypothetical protein
MRSIQWIVALSLLASPVFADDEESPKVKRARLENELEKEAESTDEKCGTKIAVKIDWASFDANPNGWQGKSISGYCEAPLGQLRYLCEGAKAKAYIQQAVKEYVCFAAKDKAGWKAVRKSGIVEWHVSPDSVNNDAYAKEQLLKNL